MYKFTTCLVIVKEPSSCMVKPKAAALRFKISHIAEFQENVYLARILFDGSRGKKVFPADQLPVAMESSP
jgi:hypothetical protein